MCRLFLQINSKSLKAGVCPTIREYPRKSGLTVPALKHRKSGISCISANYPLTFISCRSNAKLNLPIFCRHFACALSPSRNLKRLSYKAFRLETDCRHWRHFCQHLPPLSDLPILPKPLMPHRHSIQLPPALSIAGATLSHLKLAGTLRKLSAFCSKLKKNYFYS